MRATSQRAVGAVLGVVSRNVIPGPNFVIEKRGGHSNRKPRVCPRAPVRERACARVWHSQSRLSSR